MPQISFEIFPPRNVSASFQLWDTCQTLLPFAPEHISVTYGAGGSTRARTAETVQALRAQGVRVAPHLTCLGDSRAQTLAMARGYKADGIKDIVALRGDLPEGQAPAEDGFETSVALTGALAAEGLAVRVGAYPEPHPESRGQAADLDWLRAKFQAGAKAAITQFFFDAETFLRFRDACADAGISGPVVPGILPVQSWAGAQRLASRCGIAIPTEVAQGFDTAERHGRAPLFALAHAAELCTTLLEEGVEHLHFYTLNRAELTRDVCRALGLGHDQGLRNVA